MVNSPEQSGLHRPKSSTRDTWRCNLMDYWEEYITRSRKATVCLRCAACAGISRIWIDMENVWTCLDHSIRSLRQHNFHPCLHMCFQNTFFGWTFAWLCLSPSSNPWSVTTQRFQSALIQEILWSCPNLYPTSIGGYTPVSNPFKTQQSLWVSSICKSSITQNLRISLHISIYVIKPSWNIQYICDAYIYIYTMYNTSNVHYIIMYVV